MTIPDPYPLHESVSGVLGLAGIAGVPPVVVQSKSIPNALSGAFANPTTAGNTVVVVVNAFNITNGNVPSISGVTLGGAADHFTAGPVAVTGFVASSYLLAGMWVDYNCAGGQTAIAVSGSNLSVNTSAGITIYEVSGLLTTNPIDKQSTGMATVSGTSWSSGNTATTSQAYQIWFGADTTGGIAAQPGAPWVNLAYDGTNIGGGYDIVSAKGVAAYAGTQAPSGSWAAAVMTLTAATQPVPPVGTPGAVTLRISPGQPGAPGSGVGASRNSGLTWNLSGVAVSVATNNAEASCSVYVSYGIQSATPAELQGTTQMGSTGDTCTCTATLKPGDWITVVWTGGDPGAVATARIFGSVTPPGVK